MAERDLTLQLNLTAKDEASPEIGKLSDKLDLLQKSLQEQQSTLKQSDKDWLDYSEQVAATANSMAGLVSNVEDVVIKTAEIGVALTIYQKWSALVAEVKAAYTSLQVALQQAAASGAALLDAGWVQAELQAARLETTVASLTARLMGFSRVGEALTTAGIVLGLAQVGISAEASNEKTRALIEQIGGLSVSLQQLNPDSRSVVLAKERFEELKKAALGLGVEEESLVGQFKEFFDLTYQGSLSVQQSGRTLTDFIQVQKSLHATAAETQQAQEQLNDAFESGFTTIPKLSLIFGSALDPALARVAAQMGLTSDQLKALIDNGQVGAEKVIPALAAAARNITAPLHSAADAAEFSKKQFTSMGETFYELAQKQLPGVVNALQYTQREIAATADASVDPIGAAVEQIINFGARIQEWGRLTKQSINDVFAGPELRSSLDVGLKEALYGLDYLLVGLKEEFVATGQSLGVLAGAAVTATNPTRDLADVWTSMSNRVMTTRDRLNEYVDALEGVDHAAERTQAGTATLVDALKTLPEVKLPEALQDIVDKMDATKTASQAVQAAWKELEGLDFTGNNLKNFLVLNQTLAEVSQRTKDATGAQEAFGQQLAHLPIAQLEALLAKVKELDPQLKAAGDQGALYGAVLEAMFVKLGLHADEAGEKVTQYGKTAAAAFAAIVQSAEITAPQIRAALAAALDSAKTKADVELIAAEFKKFGGSGAASLHLVEDGSAAIAQRMLELQKKLPGVEEGFKSLGVTSAATLRGAADAAQAAYTQIIANGAGVKQLRDGFLAWAEAEVKAAVANDAVVPAAVRNQAAQMGLSAALEELIVKHQRLNPEFEAISQQMGRVTAFFEKEDAEARKNAQTKQVQIDASIALAKVKGDEAKAADLIAQKTARSLQDAEEEIARKKELIAKTDASINLLYAEAAAKGGMQPDQQKLIHGLMDENEERKRTIAGIEAKIPEMQREAQQAEILASGIARLNQIYEKQALEHQRAGDASTRYNELQVREAEGALRLAEINGDSNEVAHAQNELGKRKLDQAEALAKAAAVEAADAESSLSLKTAELAADGELSDADQQLLSGLKNTSDVKHDAARAAQQNVDQMRKEANAAKDAARGIDIVTSAKQRNDRVTREQIESDKEFHANAAAGADLITRILAGWSSRLEALSPVSRKMFDSFIYGSQASTKYLSEMDLKMKEIEEKQRVAYRGMANYGFVQWANTVASKALEIEKSFWAQADAADSLVKKLNGVGTSANSLQQLADQAENAKRDFNQLDNTRLDQLAHAIESARKKVDELHDATLSAQQRLVQLDEELAREQGDTRRADLLRQQIDYEQQLAEIQHNLQQAESSHNQELIQLYQQQMARLNELNDLRRRNIETENKKPKPDKPDASPDTSTNQQESDRRQIAQQNQTTDALAEGSARRSQVLNAMAQAASAAAAANATASQSIIQSNRALASALAEEGARATQSLQSISTDLSAALAQQQAEAGAALAQLEKDNTAAIVAANQAKANALAAAEADNAKKINDIHQDALNERGKLDADYQKGQQDIAARLDSNILQINQNTARGITDAYARSREEIGKIQQTFADRVQALNDQFAAQSLQSGASLAQQAEALRRQLLSQTGEQGQAVNAEFGDQIAELARMYASAGAGAQDNFNAAIERARQLNAIQLQGLLDSGKITQEQYAAAQAEAARVAASAAAQAEQERARLAAERAAKQAALEAERDQQIAAAQAVADAKKVALEEEARIKKEQLLAEITAAQAALEEDTAARRAAIDADEASRLEAQNAAHADALAKIDAELAAKLAALAAEYTQRQQAAADALAKKLADIQAEADTRAAQIAAESAARREQLQSEHDQAIKNIQDEHAARLQAIQAQAAEAAKPPPKPAEPEAKPSTAKPAAGGVGSPTSPGSASPVFTLNLVMGSKSLTATTTTNPTEFLSALERSKSLSVSP